MKIITVAGVLGVALCILASTSFGQTAGWTVVTSGRDTLYSCTLLGSNNRVMEVNRNELTIRIPLDSLAILFKHHGTHLWEGMKTGAIIGAILGGILGAIVHARWFGSQKSFDIDYAWSVLGGAVFCAVPGGIVGGAVGAASGGDELYDLRNRSSRNKAQIIGSLIINGD